MAASPHVDIVSICDIDEGPDHLERAAKHYPKAVKETDWRKVLDNARDIDAVIVSTPDHMHAPISLAAMQLGKHVLLPEAAAHTVFETRQMRSWRPPRPRVVTQMGNQIQSALRLPHGRQAGARRSRSARSRKSTPWQSGPLIWMLVDERPAGSDPIPKTLHWDEVARCRTRPGRTRRRSTIPFNWRAWQDFSTGQIGDFACHILDPVFKSLELTAPDHDPRRSRLRSRSEVWTRRSTGPV